MLCWPTLSAAAGGCGGCEMAGPRVVLFPPCPHPAHPNPRHAPNPPPPTCSGVWVDNAIDRDIALRLHVPTTPLVPPSTTLASQQANLDESDILLGPLKPKAGCYLPVTAMLGGSLFVRPEGFMEAARDVIRLTSNLLQLVGQQGYVSCEPNPLADEDTPLHVALQAVPAKVGGGATRLLGTS